MNPWKFEATGLNTLTARAAYALQVEITAQPLANWNASTADQLPTPDFTTDLVTVSDFPFTISERSLVSNIEPGCAGNAAINIEAMNIFCGADGTTVASGNLVAGQWYTVFTDTVTYDGTTYAVGQRFQAVTGTLTYTGSGSVQRNWTLLEIVQIDYSSYDLHIKISSKETGGAYIVKYWGIIDAASIQFEVYDKTKPETWILKFSADDCLQQLTKVTALKWMDATTGGLKHVDFDYSSTDCFLTYVGTWTEGGIPYPPGRYYLNRAFRQDFRNETGVWYDYDTIRWIKIVDIFQSISDFLNLEANVNDGGSWSDFHSWRFYYNTNDTSDGVGGETLSYVGIDELYVFAAFYDGASYIESYGFFDPQIEPSAPHSWKTSGSPLEVLDRICSSLGLTFRIRVNSSNQRYLEIVEYAKIQSTKTISGTEWDKVLKYAPTENTFACSGVEVVSTGSSLNSSYVAENVSRGNAEGSGTLKYDSFFLSANHIRTSFEFRRKVSDPDTSPVANALVCDVRPVDTGFTCTLWTLQGITGKAADDAYSVCMIMPKDNGAAASTDPGNAPKWAEYDGTLGGVVVPKRTGSDIYYAHIEVPGMALALYLWNNVDVATDPVGFVRPHGDEIEMQVVGVDHTEHIYPPIKLTVSDLYSSKDYVITEIEENDEEDTTTYKGHTRDV
jgi:hypothetical protein